jgi:hypothetical protein
MQQPQHERQHQERHEVDVTMADAADKEAVADEQRRCQGALERQPSAQARI